MTYAAPGEARYATAAPTSSGRHLVSAVAPPFAPLFLASDEAAYVNAVCLPVDGGLSMSCA